MMGLVDFYNVTYPEVAKEFKKELESQGRPPSEGKDIAASFFAYFEDIPQFWLTTINTMRLGHTLTSA